MAESGEDAKKTVEKWYPKLLTQIPISELVDRLDSLQLLSSNRKSKLNNLTSPEEKAKYFLDEMLIPGLSIEYTGHFDEMVKMMKESDDVSIKLLVENMTRDVSNAPSKDTSSTSIISSDACTGIEYKIWKVSRVILISLVQGVRHGLESRTPF